MPVKCTHFSFAILLIISSSQMDYFDSAQSANVLAGNVLAQLLWEFVKHVSIFVSD